jgi:predicted phage tail component-like protein
MIFFNFDGKDSFDFGIIISKRPSIPLPKRRISYIEIPGRDSSLRFDENTYDDITITVECAIKDNITNKIYNIKKWLVSAGESDLIFSFNTSRKYKAQVVNNIDFSQIINLASKFIIIFNCRPFKYSTSETSFNIEQPSGHTLNYPSIIPAKVIVKAYCIGDGIFKIGDYEVLLTDINEHIILNSELEVAYYMEGEKMVIANKKVTGEFPLLNEGGNPISFSGGVIKLEIIPNSRWL